MNESANTGLEQDILDVLHRLAAELHRGRVTTIGLDSHLERDIGLDSLARVELIARIEEHFGTALPESVYGEIETPRDLLRLLDVALATRSGFFPGVSKGSALSVMLFRLSAIAGP